MIKRTDGALHYLPGDPVTDVALDGASVFHLGVAEVVVYSNGDGMVLLRKSLTGETKVWVDGQTKLWTYSGRVSVITS